MKKMPNWVKNVIQVKGPEKDVASFIDHVQTADCAFDLEKMRPMPPELVAAGPWAKFDGDSDPAWRKNWGVTRAIETDKKWENRGKTAQFFYESAWSSPIEAIREVSGLFPTLTISNIGMDPDKYWTKKVVVKGGKFVLINRIELEAV